MKNVPFWSNPHYRKRDKLKKDAGCEFLVVGGGVTGVSLAYFLAKIGRDVILVERDAIASGASGRAAGMLAPEPESSYLQDILRSIGERKTLAFWKAQMRALSAIKRIINAERIACEFEENPYFLAESRFNRTGDLVMEYITSRFLRRETRLVSGKRLQRLINTDMFASGVFMEGGVSLNPLQYTQNLATAAERHGTRVYERTPLLSHSRNLARTPGCSISFRKIIMATDVFSGSGRVQPSKDTIAVTERLERKQLRTLGLHKGYMFENDSRAAYFYAKLTSGKRLLIGCGPLKVSSPDNTLHRPHLRKLRAFMKQLYPRNEPEIDFAWSGTSGISKGVLPAVSFSKNRAILAGGGTQVTCTLMAQYAASRLSGKKQPLDSLFR